VTVLRSLPRQVYPAQTRQIPVSAVIDPAITVLVFSVGRFSWPDTGSAVVDFHIQVSYDGGSIFTQEWAFTANGGDVFFRGVLVARSQFKVPLQPGTNRVVKGVITLTTALDADALIEGF
jgi:hypothetical protein